MALVARAAGIAGNAVVNELKRQGWRVRALSDVGTLLRVVRRRGRARWSFTSTGSKPNDRRDSAAVSTSRTILALRTPPEKSIGMSVTFMVILVERKKLSLDILVKVQS